MGQHADGLQVGEWRFYDRDTGELREVLQFVAGREVVDLVGRVNVTRPFRFQ
jgi:hypothetical protein